MGISLSRCLGPVEHLSSGEFTIETASSKPAVSCPICGTVTEIDPMYTIHPGGKVTPIWSCHRCPFLDWITLDSIGEKP